MNTGGAYVKPKTGNAKPKLVEQTQDHKDGNRARDQRGRPLNVPTAKPKGAKS